MPCEGEDYYHDNWTNSMFFLLPPDTTYWLLEGGIIGGPFLDPVTGCAAAPSRAPQDAERYYYCGTLLLFIKKLK